jgi:hypothetical protein
MRELKLFTDVLKNKALWDTTSVDLEIVTESSCTYFVTSSLTATSGSQTRLTPPKYQYFPIDIASYSRILGLSGLLVLNFETR